MDCGTFVVGGDAYVLKLEPPNTPAGQDVSVQPVDSSSATTPVELTFDQVTQSGTTTLTTSTSGPPPPAGFTVGDPPTYYDLTTTATFAGLATVCIDYTGVSYPDESALRLFHYDGGNWVDVTSPGFPDTLANLLCGAVTSLSPFTVLGAPIVPVGLEPPLAALAAAGETPLPPSKAFRQGSTLPLRLELTRNGVALTDADVGAPRIISIVRAGQAIDLNTIDVDAGGANDSGLLFRFSDDAWVYNLSTRGLATGTWIITIEMADGPRFSASFVLR